MLKYTVIQTYTAQDIWKNVEAKNKEEAVDFINEYAPEHYIINVEDETYFIENLVNAGPNLTADDSLKIFPPYLALRWFFSKPVLS